MIKVRIALLGAALSAALAIGVGAAKAQDYYGSPYTAPAGVRPYDERADTAREMAQRPYDERPYDDRDYAGPPYDRTADNDVERVIVRPYYDDIEKHQVIGRVDGEINPTAYSLSRPVDFSDLDLSRSPDRAELRIRVHETAENLCAELEYRVPALRDDRSASQRCVREAAHQAMHDVMDRS